MEKGGDLPISCGLWCFPGKMEQSEEYHNPDPTSSEGEKPEAGEGAVVHCTGVRPAAVGLWESLGLLPLTWFDPHGPMPRGHIFWEPNKSGAGFQWLKSNYLAQQGF